MHSSSWNRLGIGLLLMYLTWPTGSIFAQPAGSIGTSSIGYIDDALPLAQFRFRYDTAYDANRPGRAEMFYAAPRPAGGRGLPLGERKVDYQDMLLYTEAAICSELTFFVEGGVRFLNPQINENHTGQGDMNVGMKWAFLREEDTVCTFQLRGYAPTGNVRLGLGTGHASIEPALLLYHRLDEDTRVYAELKDWIALGGTDGVAGNVLRYGVGISYDLWKNDKSRFSPVAEVVGWTVLDGKSPLESTMGLPVLVDATGDTIVNLKLGATYTWDERTQLYIGYGFALTGEVWYRDVLRAQLRMLF